jgi:Holliday junction resolvase RusA-like endonuclease
MIFNNGYWESRANFEICFVIEGKPAVLKNSKQIVLRGERPILVPSRTSVAWRKVALKQLAAQNPIAHAITTDLWVTVVTYAHDKRRRDLDNSLSGPLDALVAAEIIKDDAQVKSLDGSRLLYDKERPRVEIVLRPYTEECGWLNRYGGCGRRPHPW